MSVWLVCVGRTLNTSVGILAVPVISFVRIKGSPSILRLMGLSLAVRGWCVSVVGAAPALVVVPLGVAVELIVVLMGAVLWRGGHPTSPVHGLGATAAAAASNETATQKDDEKGYEGYPSKDPAPPVVPIGITFVVTAIARATAIALREFGQK